ncbi:3-ketoacyl-(acyl-carrier-protein) reductase [Candidatus Rubidus massiliensis]|nr:3-ketoacyl-(acyl-carrier-protein) reductase [Candidatus Rubidus massiliensis]
MMAKDESTLYIHCDSSFAPNIVREFIASDWQVFGTGKNDFIIDSNHFSFQKNAFTEHSDIERLHNWLEDKISNLDALIIDLTIQPQISLNPFLELSLDQWDFFVNFYLKQSFFIVQDIIQEWIVEHKTGRIVFILPSKAMANDNAMYAVIQSGALAFSRSIAKEYGLKKIYSNSIIVPSNSTEEEQKEKITKAVLFFSSEASSLVDGETLVFD